MMRVFLTGGAGYVGSACLRYMLQQGHEAMAYDNLSLGHRAAVPGDRLVVGDIHDTEALVRAMKEFCPQAVMHFAASAYVGESVADPHKYYHNNIVGSLSLLRAMREAGVRRLLFSSTCSTYGEAPRLPMTETSPQNPGNPYARTKLAVEWMIRDFAAAYGLGFTLLRYFNAAGADPDGQHGEDHTPESHLIPLVLKVAMGRMDRVKVFGGDYPTPDGTCIRDYVHTYDLATAHLLAITAMDEKTAEVFNVGTGQGASVLEVIRTAQSVTGRQITYEMVERRAGDPPALVADAGKLGKQLGWSPRYPTAREVIATAWKWHVGHPGGYQDQS